MEQLIYSVKANRCGRQFSGRFKAKDMKDATNQAVNYLSQWGLHWNINITLLKNQKLAMKQWDQKNLVFIKEQ